MGQQISRRQLIGRGAAAGLGGVAIAGSASPAAAGAEERPVVSGVLEGVEGTNVARVRPLHYSTTRAPIRVEFAADASFWRDRPAPLGEFVPGDEVVAEGSWTTNSFSANRLEVLNRIVDGRVEERRSEILDTTRGNVQLTDITKPQDGPDLEAKPLEELQAGDSIFARGRADAETGMLVAYRIGVESA